MPTGSLVKAGSQTANAQRVSVANSMITVHWAGAGTTSAPVATNLPNYTIGVNAGGITTADVYHVIDGAWVDTGASVANLYGA